MTDTPSSPPANDGVAALDRAIAILDAFTSADRSLGLAEIATRTGLYKSTILRLANSLMRGQLLERLEDGRYRVGPATFRLGTLYQRSVVAIDILLPIMRDLSDHSGESVAFYVRAGDVRTCLYRVESKHPIRYTIREGDVLPLLAGSGGRVLAAFSGEPGEPYETIRKNCFYISLGDRDPQTSGVSAPVFGPGRTLVGALTLAGPSARVDLAFLQRMQRPLLEAAARATRAFGEHSPWPHEASVKADTASPT
ncbi:MULTISPECIES: IclR family transcriptional regulator [unclassified Mesorhizobium]|uniref:IclR family transcriptional regulator n=1 Tax=unclassified Mesorhizobium TaxID=325217 RepID=UPI000BAF9A4D|nr:MULTISPECIES: IclR family transcriptional regulator [unclassified Mesorhizobium]TGT63978.1 IclR family transcriptional regulator [Mesorhizobium sp. M00.F.Ca.ET.170.01.1.1]AZO11504.1 IclR family transcriptional regulator [Mesorhizobium sp. M3A.F.Ca.ET.080.04.2.1]PBB88232.1 IclR family transcriptional regulator [Mesorhizobium sp. WSM3876]RWB67318.1 MAG: IclR family transcriptional regulator [Mesorhizobium sp.]RWB91995.1 MAG: IclR family transcriptional regulator [Mesorhizobium sp.]